MKTAERARTIDTETRTPAQNAVSFLRSLCYGFTTCMTICLAVFSLAAQDQLRQMLVYGWSILLVCVVTAALQLVFFTPALIRCMHNAARTALFGVCLYAALAVVAVVAGWFPTENHGAWVTFTVSYLAALAVATLVYAAKDRRDEHMLNEALARYRRNGS